MSEPISATARSTRPEARTDVLEPRGLSSHVSAQPEAQPEPPVQFDDYAKAHGAPAVPPQVPANDPERLAQIDQFVAENADAKTSFLGITMDNDGGEIIGAALTGDSPLGVLTPGERQHMAQAAVTRWKADLSHENISDAAAAVKNSPHAARDLAFGLATPMGEAQRHFAQGGTYIETPEAGPFRSFMLNQAVALDAGATVQAFAGVEDQLGRMAMTQMIQPQREAILSSVTNGQVDGEAANRLVTAMFVHGDNFTMRASAAPMAEALATIRFPDTGPSATAARDLAADRLESVLRSEGGRDLLANENVTPELRAWAFEQVATNADWDASALENGWESDIVTRAFAAQTEDRYAAVDSEGQVMQGQILRNTVGQALGLSPDMLPTDQETTAAQEARLAAGLNHEYYSDTSHAAKVAQMIERIGGDGAKVSVVPISVTSNDFGAAVMTVFRVDRADGTTGFVDAQGKKYDDLSHWQDKNELPPGRMIAPEGLRPGAELAAPENTRMVTDTFGEWAAEVGDYAAMGLGIAAGVAVVVGTGGTAALVVAGGAGLYTAGRAGAELYDDHNRGVDVLDFSDPTNRGRWLEVAAGTLSLGAIGSGVKVANAARQGVQASAALTRTAAGLAVAADVVDGVAMADQGLQLVQNWDQLDNGDRAAGLLNIAFWGGMMAASAKAGGGSLRDAFDFHRLERTMATGTPYTMVEVDGLSPGDMRVAYDRTPEGVPTNVRIETGPGTPSRQDLNRHTIAARQIEAAGGLQGRLTRMLADEAQPPIGSAAWEARFELDKISAESAEIATQLSRGDLTAQTTRALEARQLELQEAMVKQTERLDAFDTAGRGWVAKPSNGAKQAQKLGWAEAPEGYAWVGGDNNARPSLYAKDGSLPVNEFDPIAGEFTSRYRRGERNKLNPALNPPAANMVYEMDNGQVFHTNAEGLVSRVEATLTLDAWVRDPKSQAAYGNLGTPPKDYNGGHLIARMFGGGPDRVNVVPQDASLNQRGEWRKLERRWEALLKDNQDVQVSIDVVYPDAGGPVPEKFEVSYTVDGGVSQIREIYNTKDGKQK